MLSYSNSPFHTVHFGQKNRRRIIIRQYQPTIESRPERYWCDPSSRRRREQIRQGSGWYFYSRFLFLSKGQFQQIKLLALNSKPARSRIAVSIWSCTNIVYVHDLVLNRDLNDYVLCRKEDYIQIGSDNFEWVNADQARLKFLIGERYCFDTQYQGKGNGIIEFGGPV